MVTLKSAAVGQKTPVSAYLEVQGQKRTTDAGQFAFYAGPVRRAAPGRCVRWGGSYGAVRRDMPFGHCGGTPPPPPSQPPAGNLPGRPDVAHPLAGRAGLLVRRTGRNGQPRGDGWAKDLGVGLTGGRGPRQIRDPYVDVAAMSCAPACSGR